MSKKGKKNLSGGMAGLSLEDGGSDGSDEELEQVEVRQFTTHISSSNKTSELFRSKRVPLLL